MKVSGSEDQIQVTDKHNQVTGVHTMLATINERTEYIGFSSKDILRLTDVSYDQLRYLSRDKVGLIKPLKDPNRKKAPAFYTFTQLVEIRAIAGLRNQGASLQKIRKAKDYLLNTQGNADLRNKAFIVLNNELHIINNNDQSKAAILEQITGKAAGQLVISGLIAVSSVLDELDQTANTISFEGWLDRRKHWEDQLAS